MFENGKSQVREVVFSCFRKTRVSLRLEKGGKFPKVFFALEVYGPLHRERTA